MKFSFAALAVAAGLIGAESTAQTAGFDPRDPCGQVLRAATDTDKLMVAAWAFGYVSGSEQDVRPVDMANSRMILQNIFEACARDENRSMLALLQKHDQGDAEVSGSKASATKLLEQFLQPGADLVALTTALKPTEADISAVYGEPLATKLKAMYVEMYAPGTRIGPKPDHNALLVVRGTTASLKRGDPVLRDFPGGYEDVLQYFIGDQPIVRFKFVTEGETLGLAFDGLIFVNGRWVLMPKPWRALQ